MLILMTQTFTGFIPMPTLNGVTPDTEKPKPTIKNCIDGTFQTDVEAHLRKHCGFREVLIRAYNQFVWSCFKETNNSTIVRGKDNWLYEELYVRDHYESYMYKYTDDTATMRRTFETEALRLWKVQKLLEEYGIHIFVNINPGKDVIYPEYLPANRSYTRPEGLRAYEFYKKRFDELGINYIDNVAIFKTIKDTVDYPLFYKTGIHWSSIAAVYVFDSIVRYIETIGNQNLNTYRIGDKYTAGPRFPDDDLEKVLNLAFRIKSPPYCYVNVSMEKDTSAVKPYLTTIGDSYYWNFAYYLPIQEIFRKAPFWYYGYMVYDDGTHPSGAVLDLDLEKELMRTDYIMLNYGTLQLYELGSQILPYALLHLCYDKATIDSLAHDVMETIKNYNPTLYEECVRSSKINGKSVEQNLYDNAVYLLRTEPETYLKELQGEQLPTSRNKDLKAIRESLAKSSS